MNLYDYIILGESLAGAAAAIHAAMFRMHVAWLVDSRDSGGLASLGVVAAPDGSLVFADDYERQVLTSVEGRIDILGPATSIEFLDPSFGITVWGGPLESRSIVYAPFGVEMGLPSVPSIATLFNRGVMEDAISDARFFTGQIVGVAGSGYRAAEQAIAASRVAKAVFVISDEEPDFQDLGPVLRRCPRIAVVRGKIEMLQVNGDGWLSGVLISSNQGVHTVELKALVLAIGLHVVPTVFRNAQEFERLCIEAPLFPAGLAAGVPHWNRDQARRSGELAIAAAARLSFSNKR